MGTFQCLVYTPFTIFSRFPLEGNITRFSANLRGLILLLCLVILLSGCASSPQERVWIQPPGWTRGQLIGTTESANLIPLTTDPSGNLYLAYIADQEPSGLDVVSIDPAGNLRWVHLLPESPHDSGRDARLIFRADELQVFWLDSNQVFTQAISAAGEFLGEIQQLTQGMDVDSFNLAQHGDDSLVLWFAGSADEPGVYARDLLASGAQDILIDPEGVQPDVAVDDYGVMHVVWMSAPMHVQDVQIRYQSFPPGYLSQADPTVVIETEFATTDEIEPATLGIDKYFAYIFWTAIIHTGLRAGAIDSFYLSFPFIDTNDRHFGQLLYPVSYDLTFDQPAPALGLSVGPRLAWSDESSGSDQVRELMPAESLRAETGVVFRPRVLTRSGQTQAQIGAMYFANGSMEGYQLITFTNTASMHPNLMFDEEGNAFISWLELTDVRRYSVYVAATKASFRTNFDQLTPGDYRQMVGDTIFGMVSGIILIPVAFLWMILPLASLGLTSFLRRKETRLLAPGHLVSLALAVGIYWFLKLGIFPNLRSTVPLLQWIPILPSSWYPWLGFGVPLLGSVFAVLTAVWVMHRTERTSPVIAFLIYGLIDGLITVSFYGGSLFGM